MIETPVWASPAIIARSTGAAPRQRGSSDGCTLRMSWSVSSGSLTSAPKAHRITASGCTAAMRARAASSLTDAGWSTSMPSSRAATATGGGPILRPRPCLASGRVTTSAGRYGPAARSRSTPAAKDEVPRKTTEPRPEGSPGGSGTSPALTLGRVVLGGLERGTQGPHALLALVARSAVQDQHAVEVVHLVLDDPGLEAAGFHEDVLARLVLGADPYVDRALDVDMDGRQAEAALLGPLLV